VNDAGVGLFWCRNGTWCVFTIF